MISKNLQRKNEQIFVIKNKKYLQNLIECHAPKIIVDRNCKRKGYTMTKNVDLTKMKKNYKKNVYNVVNDVFHILIF